MTDGTFYIDGKPVLSSRMTFEDSTTAPTSAALIPFRQPAVYTATACLALSELPPSLAALMHARPRQRRNSHRNSKRRMRERRRKERSDG